MIEELITSIKEAEKKAEEMIASARENAGKNEENASRSLAIREAQDNSKAKADFRNATAICDKEIAEQIDKENKVTIQAFDQTVLSAKNNVDKAVGYLTEEFLAKYVRS